MRCLCTEVSKENHSYKIKYKKNGLYLIGDLPSDAIRFFYVYLCSKGIVFPMPEVYLISPLVVTKIASTPERLAT